MHAVYTCNYEFTHVEGRLFTKYMPTLAHVQEYSFDVCTVHLGFHYIKAQLSIDYWAETLDVTVLRSIDLVVQPLHQSF